MSVPGSLLNKIFARLFSFLVKLRNGLSTLSGDDAYERYLGRWQEHGHGHKNDQPPLDRKAFYQMQQQHKWSRINRCC